MITSLLFGALLASLILLWDRPVITALVFTVAKIVVMKVEIVYYTDATNPDAAHADTILFFLAFFYLFLSCFIAWLYRKYCYKPWVIFACFVLAVPLVVT